MKFEPFEQQLLREWVTSRELTRVGKKTTVVCLEMDNGYEVLGTSSCVDPLDYDKEIGAFYATKDALRNLKLIVGYVNQEEAKFEVVQSNLSNNQHDAGFQNPSHSSSSSEVRCL